MTIEEIAEYIGLDYQNDKEIIGLNTLTDSNENELTFLENKKYISDLKNTKAAAVLITKENISEVPSGTIALICEEPYLMLARISKLFAPNVVEVDGEKPLVGGGTKVMPNVYIGKNSVVGSDCTIMAGAFIGDNVIIGNNTIIYPNVTVYRDCTIGNDVEIGANTTIDRAVFKSTIIEDGVRIDNLVHIGHNCKIGRGSILVAQVGISGSTILNAYVVMGGQSATAGHLEIAPFTTIAARGGVTKSITEPKKSWAGFPLFEHREWLKLQGKISKLLK